MTTNASCLPETVKKTTVIGIGGTGCHVVSTLTKAGLPGVRLATARRKMSWAALP